MYLLSLDPLLLSELCLHFSSDCHGNLFGTNGRAHKGCSTQRKSTGPLTAALCICHLSHLFPMTDPKEKSLWVRLTTSTVVQLVAWEPVCKAFCLFPMERGAVVKQEALLETVMSFLAPANSLRDWLLLAPMLLPRLDQANCSGFCWRAILRSKWLEDPFYQCMDQCVCFELQHVKKMMMTVCGFFKTAVSHPTGEVIMCKESYYKIRIC